MVRCRDAEVNPLSEVGGGPSRSRREAAKSGVGEGNREDWTCPGPILRAYSGDLTDPREIGSVEHSAGL